VPTYEFACAACGERFELFLPVTSKAVQPCPGCGRNVRRRISGGAAVIFRGPGFYATDYRKSDRPAQPPT
jgi:putative FmdB family regulatory protein